MRAIYGSILLCLPALAAAQKAFDVDDLVRLKRVSDVQLKPDGSALAFVIRETDYDNNKAAQAVFELDLGAKGAKPRRMTQSGSSAMHPRYSSDGKALYFLSSRSGSMQVWKLDGPGEAQAVTSLPLDVGGFLLSPAGDKLAVALEVYPECGIDFDCTKKKAAADAEEKPTGTLHDKLFIRHWDTWKRGTRAQLFVFDLGAGGAANPRWVSKGLDGDAPTKPFGDMGEVAFTPDGSSITFTLRIAGTSEPWSTNTDLYSVALGGGEPVNLTPELKGYDNTPVYSTDGKRLYWKSMARAGYEADRARIFERVLATGVTREVAPSWDRSPDTLVLSEDGRTIYTYADDLGQRRLFAIDVKSGQAKRLTESGAVSGFALGSNKIYALLDDLDSPADVYSIGTKGGAPSKLTDINSDRLPGLKFGAFEQFSFAGWNGATVYGWLVKPIDFDPGKKYPIAFIVHGGPQGSMGNSFHYRWNPQTYAGKGFAAVFIDFHGSTGYGQAFTDAIRGDWGGKPLDDLKKGMAAALDKYPFLDGSRACALGASYGGYMMNWIAGAWNDGFRCIVNHAGIFDNRFMSYTTEELWFDEWEFEGTAFDRPGDFEKQNPVNLVRDWKTPMLVTHGMLDFRVPFEQGIAAFTALQRRGIESQFLWFPDENHWILKPQNSVQWHRAVEAWLSRWTQAPQ